MSTDRNCVKQYPSVNAEAPAWDKAAVEAAWGAPLSEDLVLIGGVDSFGWTRACRVSGPDADLFEGEYRDQTTWYRGRFRLQAAPGQPVPADALERFYVSHFSYPEGLVLYPIHEGPPPVRTLLLVPIDPTGYAVPIRE